jgi:predicted Zn-ribbon and HTH transcriptional regulator
MKIETRYRKVWENHNGKIPVGSIIHHLDGNPFNNNISNLVICKNQQEHISKYHICYPNKKQMHVKCFMCGHVWAKKTIKPEFCPVCKSPKWDIPRK